MFIVSGGLKTRKKKQYLKKNTFIKRSVLAKVTKIKEPVRHR